MRAEIIRASGAREAIENTRSTAEIAKHLGTSGMDTVNLRNGWTMFVDDLGVAKDLPVNDAATRLYHSICYPGTTHQIRGDVVIVRSW